MITFDRTDFQSGLKDIQDVEIVRDSDETNVYVKANGHIYSFSLSPSGMLSFLYSYPNFYTSLGGYYGEGKLISLGPDYSDEILSIVGETNLNGGMSFYQTLSEGRLVKEGDSIVDTSSASLRSVMDATTWKLYGDTYVAVSSYAEGAVTIFRYSGDGAADLVATATGENTSEFMPNKYYEAGFSYKFHDVVSLNVKGKTYIYAGTSDSRGVAAFEFLSTGEVKQVDMVFGDGNILPVFQGKSILASASIGGKKFILNHAGGEMFVYRANGDGTLVRTFDDLHFDAQYNSEIEVVEFRGHTFALFPDWRAGDDGGFSIYELSSDGILTYETSVTWNGVRSDVTAIDTIRSGNGYHVIYGDEELDTLVSQYIDMSDVGYQKFGKNRSEVLKGVRADDYFNGRGGDDKIFGRNGEDELRGGRGSDKVFGGAGNDELSGNSGNDKLNGQAGNDRISGGLGRDKIFGGSGDDTLNGGRGPDLFFFKDGFGADTLTDFNAVNGKEDINLRNVSSITDFSDLLDNHMTQVGPDVLINAGVGDILTIENVSMADLGEADFVF